MVYQVDGAGAGEPDGDEDGAELRQPDGAGRLQYVQVLQDVRHRHQPQRAQKPQTCRTHHTGQILRMAIDLPNTPTRL